MRVSPTIGINIVNENQQFLIVFSQKGCQIKPKSKIPSEKSDGILVVNLGKTGHCYPFQVN